jgi:hypothetical protein
MLLSLRRLPRPNRFAASLALVAGLLTAASPAGAHIYICDESLHGHDAAFMDYPSFVPACVVNGLSLVGLQHYGLVPASPDQMSPLLTVEGYVNWSGLPGEGDSLSCHIIDKFSVEEGGAARSWILGITRSTGRLFARAYSSPAYQCVQVDDPDPLPSGRCAQIAFTAGDSFLRLYVNGLLKAESPFGGPINYDQNTAINLANGQDHQEEWVGIMDEIRVSDLIRTSFPPVGDALLVDEHTVALWRFDADGPCPPTPAIPGTWGKLKAIYR